jgi:hypothetical protein
MVSSEDILEEFEGNDEEVIDFEGVTIKKSQVVKAEDFPRFLNALAKFNRKYNCASVVVVVDREGKLRDLLKPTDIAGFLNNIEIGLKQGIRLDYLTIDCTLAPPRPNKVWMVLVAFLTIIRLVLCVAVLYLKELRPKWLVREGDVVVEVV